MITLLIGVCVWGLGMWAGPPVSVRSEYKDILGLSFSRAVFCASHLPAAWKRRSDIHTCHILSYRVAMNKFIHSFASSSDLHNGEFRRTTRPKVDGYSLETHHASHTRSCELNDAWFERERLRCELGGTSERVRQAASGTRQPVRTRLQSRCRASPSVTTRTSGPCGSKQRVVSG